MAGDSERVDFGRGTAPIGPGSPDPSALSVNRAFVVHFHATGRAPRRRYHGRVEHLESGRWAYFSSLDRLLGFVAAILDGAEPPGRIAPPRAG